MFVNLLYERLENGKELINVVMNRDRLMDRCNARCETYL